MSRPDAEATLGELMGTLESPVDKLSRKGCIRLQTNIGKPLEESDCQYPPFYGWVGNITISAPKEILNSIVLPVVRVAANVGGVGRGWRRPLHTFVMNNGRPASRGTLLRLKHKHKKKGTNDWVSVPYSLPIVPLKWSSLYDDWRLAVRAQWPNRVIEGFNNPAAEVFSPRSCAVYVLPGPPKEPIDRREMKWLEKDSFKTRGQGMDLVYRTRQGNPPRNYKRNPDLGGNAGSGGAYCSWVSVKGITVLNERKMPECKEVVCLFMGGQTPRAKHVRSQFLQDLENIEGGTHLFGVTPP